MPVKLGGAFELAKFAGREVVGETVTEALDDARQRSVERRLVEIER